MKGRHAKVEDLCLIVSCCFNNGKVGLGDSLSGALTLFNCGYALCACRLNSSSFKLA